MQRVERLLARLPNGAQAALVHNASNMRYFSGYTGEGLLVLAPGLAAIVTDFRYTEQAQQQAPGFAVLEISPEKGHNLVALEALDRAGAKTIALEEEAVSYAKYKSIVRDMPGKTFVSLEKVPELLRRQKDDQEIDCLTRANALTSQAFEYILTYVKPGMTERQIALELERYMLEKGADSTSFSTIVASGENGSLPHAEPGDRKLQLGDLVTLDFGAKVDGYCADMTRTFAVGEISPELRKIYDTVHRAQQMALEAVKAGASCRGVDKVARDYIYAQGYEGKFGHGLGHSTGLDIHEDPRCNSVSADNLELNMTMTIEPGIYVAGLGGVRIEDSVLVTADGCRILTPATKELITIK